jgi:hypothetical protein
MRTRAANLITMLAILVLAPACNQPDQVTVESSIAIQLMPMLKKRDHLSMGRLTNFAQLFIEHRPGGFYPYAWDRELRSFGKRAGFENSFYEKYIVLPPRLTNLGFPGEPILLTTKPFKDREGQLSRILIVKIGLDHQQYGYYPLRETNVLDAFARANVAIAKAERFPAPPPPPPEEKMDWPIQYKMSDFFVQVTRRLGMDTSRAPFVQAAALIGLPILLLCFVLWSWNRHRKARESPSTGSD